MITYTYDALNRLTNADYSDSTSYEYDKVGNREATTTTASGVITYVYDAANPVDAGRTAA